MDFVAIDFETANEKRSSPCSLGIVVVKNNKIVEKKYWLIRPKEVRFESMNVWIHGITEEQVENEKEFYEIWNDIRGYLLGNLVVAHNASFDLSVLRKTLDLYNIPYPELDYYCTMLMSRNFYPYLENSKLNTVNEYLGFSFNHHDALEDAIGAANIFISVVEELNIDSIEKLSELLNVSIGRLNNDGYRPSSRKADAIIISNKGSSYKKKELEINRYAFNGKVVVFTGPLSKMKRADAMVLVRKAGGSTGSSVTKKTNVLVLGGKCSANMNKDRMSNKLRRATSLKGEGQDISILSEGEFLDVIKSYK